MVPTNVIQRTLFIRRNLSRGTAFTLDRGGRHYLVTARHVVEGIKPGQPLEIWHDGRWKLLSVDIVGVGQGRVDGAVFAPSIQLSPPLSLEPGAGGMYYGQQAYILGFPHGRHSGGEEINRGLPIPFVKSGIVGGFDFGEIKMLYLDMHVNEGFSGGPVVFRPAEGRGNPTEFRVAGVVSGYLKHDRPLHGADGNHLGNVGENTGIAIAIGIQHITDLIDANPIGLQLSAVFPHD